MPPIKRQPSEKAVNNKKAIKNILFLLKDYKFKLIITFICAVISTLFSIIAPFLIGMATTIIFDGINAMNNHTGTIYFNNLFFLLGVVVDRKSVV